MVYVAGAGKDYCSLRECLPFSEYVLLDSNPNKIGKLFMDKEVFPYSELSKASSDDVVYVSSERYFDDISDTIRDFNKNVSIVNLAEYIWKKIKDTIPSIISNNDYTYDVTIDVKEWLNSALIDETTFWRWALVNAIEQKDERLMKREFDYPFQKIEINGNSTIIDVGCGLLPQFGNQLGDAIIDYHPVDPLAYEYNKILAENSVVLPVSPEFAIGELLSKFFLENSADFVIMNNALDHCIDPIRVLVEMLKVCKVNGNVIMLHADSEGIFENYSGMHKWNISEYKGNLFIFDNKGNVINVNKYLDGVARVTVNRIPLDYRDGILCKIEKTTKTVNELEGTFSDISGELIKELFDKLCANTSRTK